MKTKYHIIYLSIILGMTIMFNDFIKLATRHDDYVSGACMYMFEHLGDPIKK